MNEDRRWPASRMRAWGEQRARDREQGLDGATALEARAVERLWKRIGVKETARMLSSSVRTVDRWVSGWLRASAPTGPRLRARLAKLIADGALAGEPHVDEIEDRAEREATPAGEARPCTIDEGRTS